MSATKGEIRPTDAPIKRALLSVSDKAGIVDLARGLSGDVVRVALPLGDTAAGAAARVRVEGRAAAVDRAARDIGERVLPRLRALDQVAYVRFASIYRDFRDLEGFEKELDALRNDTGPHELPAPEDRTDEHAAVPAPGRAG